MDTATHTPNGRPAQLPRLAGPRAGAVQPAVEQLALAGTFADTVVRYLLRVLPEVRRELADWQQRAAQIPDLALRRHAFQALAKRGNIEGAALFAVLAPASQRRRTVRALVAYQTAYNYLDTLSECPSPDPVANGDQLHQALLIALYPGASHLDYYAHNPDSADGGYLRAILDASRDALARMPSFSAVAPTARAAAARILDFQALNLTRAQGGHEGLQRWATESTPPGSGLQWWETAAAAGSSLSVHALIAAAADPGLDAGEAREIDRAYYPFTGALHSLLDSLVDRGEDHEQGQRSLLAHNRSPAEAEIRLAFLAARSRAAVERLSDGRAHRVIVTAMCSYYLSAPECDTHESARIGEALARALGPSLRVAILLFRARRMLHAATHRAYT